MNKEIERARIELITAGMRAENASVTKVLCLCLVVAIIAVAVNAGIQSVELQQHMYFSEVLRGALRGVVALLDSRR